MGPIYTKGDLEGCGCFILVMAVLASLGIWKVVDIIIWIIKNVNISIG